MGIVKVGVLGGTFNPIHFGHLHIAQSVQKLFSLSRVYFVVATMPPHKNCEFLIPFTHRYAMVSLALADHPQFIPSMVELEPRASVFSVDTMKKLSSRPDSSGDDLYFIAGGDSLAEVKSWRASERLLTAYNFIFAMRPGVRPPDFKAVLPERAVARVRDLTRPGRSRTPGRLAGARGRESRIYIVDVGAPDISATRIRDLAASGKSVRRMVPGCVDDYIRKLHLYGER